MSNVTLSNVIYPFIVLKTCIFFEKHRSFHLLYRKCCETIIKVRRLIDLADPGFSHKAKKGTRRLPLVKPAVF